MTMHRLFASIGIVFGASFVFVNAADLPGLWPWIARGGGVVSIIAAGVFGVVRADADPIDHSARSTRVYWIAVAAELVAIPVGAALIADVFDRPELTVTWVVFVVGAHFVPAGAFGFGHWTRLGVALMVLAAGGAFSQIVIVDWAASAAAVLAGFSILIFVSTAGPPTTSDARPGPTSTRGS